MNNVNNIFIDAKINVNNMKAYIKFDDFIKFNSDKQKAILENSNVEIENFNFNEICDIVDKLYKYNIKIEKYNMYIHILKYESFSINKIDEKLLIKLFNEITKHYIDTVNLESYFSTLSSFFNIVGSDLSESFEDSITIKLFNLFQKLYDYTESCLAYVIFPLFISTSSLTFLTRSYKRILSKNKKFRKDVADNILLSIYNVSLKHITPKSIKIYHTYSYYFNKYSIEISNYIIRNLYNDIYKFTNKDHILPIEKIINMDIFKDTEIGSDDFRNYIELYTKLK